MLGEGELSSIISVAERVSDKKKEEMRAHGLWLYSKYFSTIEKLTRTTLDILNYRVYPHTAALYKDWNNPPALVSLFYMLFYISRSFYRYFFFYRIILFIETLTFFYFHMQLW